MQALSAGKIAGFLYAIIGLFIGAVIAVFALFGGLLTGTTSAAHDADAPTAALGALFGVAGVAAIVIAPLLYGFMGFLSAIVMAVIYNIVSRIVGGIEVDVA